MRSPSTEDYVRAIERCTRDGGARVNAIATDLGVTRPSVSQKLTELERQGFVARERYGPVGLTRKGATLARKMTYRHRIIEVFLADTLKLPHQQVHAQAHRLEHAFSDEAIVRLAVFLQHPTKDPHGKPIRKVR